MAKKADLYQAYKDFTALTVKTQKVVETLLEGFLKGLRFAWDDTQKGGNFLQPFLALAEAGGGDIQENLQETLTGAMDYQNGIIQWLQELQKKQDLEADKHIDKAYDFFKKELGDSFPETLIEHTVEIVTAILDQAGLDLPEDFKVTEDFKRKLRKSSLEAATEPLADLIRSLGFVGENTREEDAFLTYVISCRYLNEYRQEAYLIRQAHGKIKPNAPCPCESGRKWKYCHGKFPMPF